jgi:hypothetical protein
MDFRLGVLLIHGMGSQQAGFAGAMIEELKARVRRAGGDDRAICFQEVWWAPVLAQKQVDLVRDLADGNDLDWMPLRRFVIGSLADAVAYQASYRKISADQVSVYKLVHGQIAADLGKLRRRLRLGKQKEAPEAPLVIVAHSLGGHMITNYVWDVRHAKSKPKNAFERLETLCSLITMGCNIPLFTLAFEELEPIDFPTPGVEAFFPAGTAAEELAEVTQWWNFYDPDDVLGYPLRTLGPAYARVVSRDVAVDAGGLLRSWNPASHTAYWTDDDVTRPVAKLLARILALLGA